MMPILNHSMLGNADTMLVVKSRFRLSGSAAALFAPFLCVWAPAWGAEEPPTPSVSKADESRFEKLFQSMPQYNCDDEKIAAAFQPYVVTHDHDFVTYVVQHLGCIPFVPIVGGPRGWQDINGSSLSSEAVLGAVIVGAGGAIGGVLLGYGQRNMTIHLVGASSRILARQGEGGGG